VQPVEPVLMLDPKGGDRFVRFVSADGNMVLEIQTAILLWLVQRLLGRFGL
jgi:hypothetical protein